MDMLEGSLPAETICNENSMFMEVCIRCSEMDV